MCILCSIMHSIFLQLFLQRKIQLYIGPLGVIELAVRDSGVPLQATELQIPVVKHLGSCHKFNPGGGRKGKC